MTTVSKDNNPIPGTIVDEGDIINKFSKRAAGKHCPHSRQRDTMAVETEFKTWLRMRQGP
jgi:hypothetical protein